MNWLNDMFHKIFLLIDGGIYWLVSQVYQIFLKLANARIFEDSFFSNFAQRIYALLGVIMLFYLAYALLNAIIDPDKATSGDKGLPNVAKNTVISLVILGLLPMLFNYAYQIQGIIFKENVLGAIIFGQGGSGNEETLEKYGNYMAYTALNPFLNPGNYNVNLDDNYSWFDLKKDLLDYGEFTKITRMSDWAINDQELISDSADGLTVGTMVSPEYKPLISTACGVVLLYIMISFCLDLGVRIFKFAFCQLLAPIPVIMRIIPAKKQVFDKWLKLTLTVYFEVFIRVGIMYMVIYFFSSLANSDVFSNVFSYASGGIQGVLALAVILMGLLVFAKTVPKMIGDVLGLDSGNIKLGIGEKLKAGGFFAAGSVVGAGATMATRNLISGGKNLYGNWKSRVDNIKNASSFKEGLANVGGLFTDTAKGVLGTSGSVLAGTVAGGTYAFSKGGKDAKNFGDTKKYASEGVAQADENKLKREKFKANHGGTVLGAARGHLSNLGTSISNWAGIDDSIKKMESSQKIIADLESDRKSLRDAIKFVRENVEKNNRNVNFSFKTLSGQQITGSANLALLERQYAQAENNGTDFDGNRLTAEQIENMRLQLDAARKQADKDIVNGLKADGSGDHISADQYNGNVKAALTKLMTTTRAAAIEVENNLSIDANKTAFSKAKEFSDLNYNKDVVNSIINGSVEPSNLIDDLNKPILESKGNVNTKINQYYQQKNNNK